MIDDVTYFLKIWSWRYVANNSYFFKCILMNSLILFKIYLLWFIIYNSNIKRITYITKIRYYQILHATKNTAIMNSNYGYTINVTCKYLPIHILSVLIIIRRTIISTYIICKMYVYILYIIYISACKVYIIKKIAY